MKRSVDPDISSRKNSNGSCFAPERRISQELERVPLHRFQPKDEELVATLEEGKKDSRIMPVHKILHYQLDHSRKEDSSDFGL